MPRFPLRSPFFIHRRARVRAREENTQPIESVNGADKGTCHTNNQCDDENGGTAVEDSFKDELVFWHNINGAHNE